MLNIRPNAIAVLSLLLGLSSPTLLVADPAASACEPNQASTQPCVINLPGLGTQPLVQTLPFDVPVFLAGKGPPELQRIAVHIFHAHEPFRVEQRCTDPVDPATCTYPCFRQGARSHRESGDQVTPWRRQDLEAKVESIACDIAPSAAEWRSPTSPSDEIPSASSASTESEQPYLLRLPPFEPNEYFVLMIEDERRLTPEELERVQRKVANEISRLIDSFEADASTSQLNDWLSKLVNAGCETLRQIAHEEKLKLVAEEGSLLDCSTQPYKWRNLDSLTDYLSAKTEYRSRLEGCGADSKDLESALRDLRHHLESRNVDTSRWNTLQHLREDPHRPATLAKGEWVRRGQEGSITLNPCDVEDIDHVLAGYTTLARTLHEVKVDLQEIEDDPALAAAVARAQGLAESLRGEAAEVKIGINTYASRVAAILTNTNFLMGDTIGTFLTRQKGYLAADFGFAFAPELEVAVPYLGTNIYLRPVNKNEPLAFGDWRNWRKRFAFSVGIALEKIDDEQVAPLFSDLSLLTGGGFRVTEAARISSGVVWVREKSQSPLATSDSLTWSPYISLSLDYDVNSLIKWFDKVFGGA